MLQCSARYRVRTVRIARAMTISLQTVSKWFLYASLFCVVIVLPSIFFPFIGGKYYFFRVAVELALMSFILWWGFQAKKDEATALFKETIRQPLVVAVSAFVFAFLVATIFARDSYAAFWSNYERGDGGFQILHYYAFFLLLAMLFREWKDWRRAFSLFLFAASAMILYGVGAYFVITDTGKNLFCPPVMIEGATSTVNAPRQCLFPLISSYQSSAPPATFWGKWVRNASGTLAYEPGILTGTRFQGSLGNPAYVSPYLMFALFFLGMIWTARQKKHRVGWFSSLTWWHIGYAALALFYLLFFVLAQTRGAFLGLGAGVLAFLLYFLFAWRKGRMFAAVLLAVFVIGGSILFGYRDTTLVKSLPGSRFLDLSFSERTFQTRIWTWSTALEAWKESPKTVLFGWGPENFSMAFDKYFNPLHHIPRGSTETWFDRAHSVLFDYLAETGLLGLIAYLGIFVVLYVQFFKKMMMHTIRGRGTDDVRRALQEAAFFAMPIGYLVQGVVLFDVLPIYLGLFLFIAFGTFLFRRATHSPEAIITNG